ncbi:SUMF1/EgtB/PvdO family nonheme iron enzyme [Anaerolineales bacterium HSG25]|nr:SUMF1/EgtB/PvdO family nonheme iron enzyme [Anaerolineales bacterium HSG25]
MLSKTIYLSITVILLLGLYSQSPQSYAQNNYEPNDDCGSATAIEPDGTRQTHTFITAADEDWLSFSVISGTEYLVDIQPPLQSLADLIVAAYDGCNTVPTDTKNETFTPGARLRILAPADGTYYLKITSALNPLEPQTDYSYYVTVQDIPQIAQPGALILVAGRLRTADPLQQNIFNVTDEVYKLFLDNGYTREEIYYMAHEDHNPGNDSLPDVDNIDPNPVDLQNAITQWAVDKVGPNRAFTLYLMDHGTENKIYLDGTGQTVTADELNAWLTKLEQAAPGVRINVIIEACHSGSFVKTLSKSGRLIMTSTASASVAYASIQGKRGAIFSDAFVNGLGRGMSLFNSFEEARSITESAHKDQQPWLDDNGDGLYTAEDGQEAAKRGFAYAGTFPGVGNYPPYPMWAEVVEQNSSTQQEFFEIGQQLNIRTRVTDDTPNGNITVWVRIYPHDYLPPVAKDTETLVDESDLEEKLLNDQDVDTVYEGTHTFTERGTYQLVIYARDEDGALGRPRRLTVKVGKPKMYLPNILVYPTSTPTPIPTPTVTPTPTATPINMAFVPAGEFTMGSDSGESDEKPVHTVSLDTFYIDKYEVTNAQYATFLNEQGNQTEGGVPWLDAADSSVEIHQQGDQWRADEGYSNHPVVEVTWYGAGAYCSWADKRLPTEAEWEKAARGTTAQTYPWGNTFDGSRLNFCDKQCIFSWADQNYDDGYKDTAPIGSYPNGVSPYGVYDMAGNVEEWVQDCYNSSYYGDSPDTNPINESLCSSSISRVLRGGSYFDKSSDVRTTARSFSDPTSSYSWMGFRCVR